MKQYNAFILKLIIELYNNYNFIVYTLITSVYLTVLSFPQDATYCPLALTHTHNTSSVWPSNVFKQPLPYCESQLLNVPSLDPETIISDDGSFIVTTDDILVTAL